MVQRLYNKACLGIYHDWDLDNRDLPLFNKLLEALDDLVSQDMRSTNPDSVVNIDPDEQLHFLKVSAENGQTKYADIFTPELVWCELFRAYRSVKS